MEEFANNLDRLIGLHGLYHREFAKLLDISPNTIQKWKAGDRSPSFPVALKVAEFFGVPMERLANAQFEDLLAHEIADPERYRATEARIHKAQTGLKAVT